MGACSGRRRSGSNRSKVGVCGGGCLLGCKGEYGTCEVKAGRWISALLLELFLFKPKLSNLKCINKPGMLHLALSILN